ELARVVAQALRIALGVEEPREPGREVDRERTVRGGNLAQIARGFARDARFALAALERELRDAAAERRPREDVLAHEARHLVARAAQAALGALERERGLPRDE